MAPGRTGVALATVKPDRVSTENRGRAQTPGPPSEHAAPSAALCTSFQEFPFLCLWRERSSSKCICWYWSFSLRTDRARVWESGSGAATQGQPKRHVSPSSLERDRKLSILFPVLISVALMDAAASCPWPRGSLLYESISRQKPI